MNLDVGRVRCFAEVAERGTVAAAADALGYSGPAVSQQLTKLELELGVKLFDRVGGRLRLSGHGRIFQAHAYEILDQVELAYRSVEQANVPASPVCISAFSSALSSIVARQISSWLGDETRPRIRIKAGQEGNGLRELALGQCDIAIVGEHSHIPEVRDLRFCYEHLMTDELVLVVGQAMGCSARSVAELSGEPWIITTPGSPCQLATLEACKAAGFVPDVVAEAPDHDSALALVAAGAGVALVPRLAISRGYDELQVLSFATGIRREIYAIVRKSGSTDSTQQVIAELRTQSTRLESNA